jgi:hypothetical protein
MSENSGLRTYTASEAIGANIRVKLIAESATVPVEVEIAGLGDQHIGITECAVASGDPVAVRLRTYPGTQEIVAADSFAVGAVLYGAAAGKVTDNSAGAGNAIGQAMEAAGALNDIVEMVPYNVLSDTAANIEIVDSANHTLAANVEASLAELYVDAKSTQCIIPIPLSSLTLETGAALTTFVSAGDATCGFSQEANKEIVLRWNNHGTPPKVAAFGIPLPADLNPGANVVVHWRAKMSGATDSPVLEHECYLGAGDADCAGADDEIDGTTNLTEYTATIAHADVGGSPEELTLIFGPKATELATDDLLVYSVWLEYTRQVMAA